MWWQCVDAPPLFLSEEPGLPARWCLAAGGFKGFQCFSSSSNMLPPRCRQRTAQQRQRLTSSLSAVLCEPGASLPGPPRSKEETHRMWLFGVFLLLSVICNVPFFFFSFHLLFGRRFFGPLYFSSHLEEAFAAKVVFGQQGLDLPARRFACCLRSN